MNTYYLKMLRSEADKYYHLRINTSGEYDISFHNYKVARLCTVKTREEGFKKLNEYKRKHIEKRLQELKRKYKK